MANQWLRLWHDMPNDPKWRTIARISKQPITAVISVYIHIMVNASESTERGCLQNFIHEDIASALDLDVEQVDSIIDAMQGRVLEADIVKGWDKRQPAREDDSKDRVRKHRESKSNGKKEYVTHCNDNVTHCNAPDTDTDTDTEDNSSTNVLLAGKPQEDAPLPLDEQPSLKNKKPQCPHQEIIALYHEKLPMCPAVREWTDARAAKLRTRWNENQKRQSLEWWAKFFDYVARSEFLTGRGPPRDGRVFLADLEWLISPGNMTKTIEGKYHRNKK